MFKNALVSVSEKEGLVEFLRPFADKGLRIVSTGGTAKHLRDHGFKVDEVSDQTGFPEVMNGRVRTLHPRIHMALLARNHSDEDLRLLKEQELLPFDLVVGSLYPFQMAQEKSLPDRELIEFIDIGGPTLLRAAAKNFERITVVCDPSDYLWIAKQGVTSLEERRALAAKVFGLTAEYDRMIAEWMSPPQMALRYGENPHQKASWRVDAQSQNGWQKAKILQGKVLSYNNLLDLEAARNALLEFTEPCVVAVKHNNPCGVGLGANLEVALIKAFRADPVSLFGGIVAINGEVTEAMAKKIGEIFLECVVAPSFSTEALSLLSKKKNLRLLEWPELMMKDDDDEVRSIAGGYLIQDSDHVGSWSQDWECLGQTPQGSVRSDLELAWKICAYLKSNSIALVQGGQSVGLGMGQVNRIDAVEQSIGRAQKHHPDLDWSQVVAASDAFFPFSDSVERLARCGVKWIIQPGGSLKDEEVFESAQRLGVNLVLTHCRHFKH